MICKRIACIFGNQKATVKVRNSADYVLKNKLDNIIKKQKDFYFPISYNAIPVRIPKDNTDVRPINYISTEELAEAMRVIAENSVGITRESLYTETARTFGFNRAGGNITQAMIEACEVLVKSGKVKEIEGKIIC